MKAALKVETAKGELVTVVIVTHNSANHLGSCLDALLLSEREVPLQILVVDNASTDSTRELATKYSESITLIANKDNPGFAAGCNTGIAQAKGEFVLLLNPDASVKSDTIPILLDYLESHDRTGIVGPRLVNGDGTLPSDTSVTGCLPSFWQAIFEYTPLRKVSTLSGWDQKYFLSNWDRSGSRSVAMVQGACLLVRRSVLNEVGLLDPGYFLYFEETDLCARAARANWEIHFVGSADCIHSGGHSMPSGRQHTAAFFQSFYRYHRIHNGLLSALALRGILTFSFITEYLLLLLLVRSRKYANLVGLTNNYRKRVLFHLGLLR